MKRMNGVWAGVLAAGLALSGCGMVPGMGDWGWTTLLDGPKGLQENWDRVGEANWRVVDGIVQADGGKSAGFLVTKGSYKDFMIRAEFWASDDANSGIYLRCADAKKITDKSCYEANIFDQRPDPSYGTGGIVHIAKVSPMPKAGGRWNVYEITAKGPRLTVVLNGERTADVEHGQFASGPIALQWGRGVIKFRKVQVKAL